MIAPNDGPLTAPAAAERPAATPSGRARGRLATLSPYALSLLAVCTLALLAWAAILLVRQPYSGLNWSYTTGVVQTVDPHGPGAALFQPGDRLVAVDGAPVYAARDLPGLRAGDWVILSVVREGVESARRLQLVASPPAVLFGRLAVILVALSFWLLGTLVLALGPSNNLITLFFLFCQAFAAALVSAPFPPPGLSGVGGLSILPCGGSRRWRSTPTFSWPRRFRRAVTFVLSFISTASP